MYRDIWDWLCEISLGPWLAWQAASKRIKVQLDLLTDIDMLLMGEKGIRRGICLFTNSQKLLRNTWKTMVIKKNRRDFNIEM